MPPAVGAGLLASLAAGWALFHWWTWDCQLRAFPAFRGTFPVWWRMPQAHWITLQRLWR
ncbi:unnamed protein product, partial [Symbiodinium pilosum]